MKPCIKVFVGAVVSSWLISALSCTSIDLYEKSASIPGHAWQSSFTPSFTFTIKDTTASYRLWVVLRHTDKYNFNNLYVNIITRQPGQDSTQKARYDLTLATNEKGWLASGMDDIYEHRIPLTPAGQDFYFKKPGEYTFTIEQIMRENPLLHVMNVGIRLEKNQ
jgi:gliding motility-associated lipoprotein GldH